MDAPLHSRRFNKQTAIMPDYQAHPSALIDAGAQIGADTRIWHFCHISAESTIGERCSFGQNCFVAPGVHIGNGVKVQNNVSLYTGVIVEDDVFLGPSCVLTNVINPRAAVSRKDEYKTTWIKKGVTIGANATIVCGVTIGEYAFIAAGAVVTKDVPAHALMKGTAARQDGWMSTAGEKLQFDQSAEATCPRTGQRYSLRENTLHSIDA